MRTRPLLALAAALTLAACTQAPTSPSADLVTLTLDNPLRTLAPQGLPTDRNGQSAVTKLKVTIKDERGQPVTFNDQNVYQADGPRAFLTLTPDSPNLTFTVPRGTYTFESVGTTNKNNFLAYGQTTPQAVQSPQQHVRLVVHTLVDPRSPALSSRLPSSSVFMNDELELTLGVGAYDFVEYPDVSDPAAYLTYRVPTSDLSEVTYTVSAGQGTILSSSKVGARVRVTDGDADNLFRVTATFKAWAAASDGSQTATLRTFTTTRTHNFQHSTSGADFRAPSVTVRKLAPVTVGQPLTIQGTASDRETGIAALRVYQGPVLIGSTDPSDTARGDVQPVTFTFDNWTMNWTATVPTPEIKVIAEDRGGNENTPVYDEVSTYNQQAASCAYSIWVLEETASIDLQTYLHIDKPEGATTITIGPDSHGQPAPDTYQQDVYSVCRLPSMVISTTLTDGPEPTFSGTVRDTRGTRTYQLTPQRLTY
ncbi:hypothetical protein [Deinococcus maricopensis]|uniref:Lipoprotein n=1 Tax=Deinococcus maricopensis (strain DSM 21211 / LMG 22137 / NRRL B-23946 / LB-34) TaxID=709986 RepID=E8UAZ0_DEIML|nr:hypothetical protein [Deinococcus maricopensis]ADV68229.1 hypothetical protein Deima_2596 [Deinococcus maricopensis DSM 21211]